MVLFVYLCKKQYSYATKLKSKCFVYDKFTSISNIFKLKPGLKDHGTPLYVHALAFLLLGRNPHHPQLRREVQFGSLIQWIQFMVS